MSSDALRTSRTPRRAAAALLALPLLLAAGSARAQLGGGEEAAIRALFPGADRIEARDVLLTDALVARIERLARARVQERLVTFYAAHRAGAVAGYAVIHSHVVRTKRETLAIAFEPDGRIRKIQVLAFLEPEEYRPSDRWLAQFAGKGPADPLRVGDDVVNATGSTLTSRGIAEQSRWLLQALRSAVIEQERAAR
ncbi:MAG TPA: FMN-binding protein [Anaeromyxobacteraceae bacterium]|nr:FMN-binding protein [Anaeromyxobacteraceae bacterium]